MSNLGIRQLAKRAGGTIETVRDYERNRLLARTGRLASAQPRARCAGDELSSVSVAANALRLRGATLRSRFATAPTVAGNRYGGGRRPSRRYFRELLVRRPRPTR